MKKILFILILIPNLGYAGIRACHDGGIYTGETGPECRVFNDGGNTHSGNLPYSQYLRVKQVLETVPFRYIKWDSTFDEPVEMDQSEKDAVDAQAVLDQKNALRSASRAAIQSISSENQIVLRAIVTVLRSHLNTVRTDPTTNHGVLTQNALFTEILNEIDSIIDSQ